MLESDHGGIERTSSLILSSLVSLTLESDHGGIERSSKFKAQVDYSELLESDHGGIESNDNNQVLKYTSTC